MTNFIKVIWEKPSHNLIEITQQTGMLFSFVSSPRNGLQQCHEWVKCRDFLADAVRSQIIHKPCKIYGFTFNTNRNPPIDLNKMRMLVTKTPLLKKDLLDFKRKMKAGLKLVNHFETMIGVSKTKLSEVDTIGQTKYKSIFLFTGSVIWLKSPFLVSMYSFLIRLGDKEFSFTNNSELEQEFKKLSYLHATGVTKDNDAYYLNILWDKLALIMKNRLKLFPIKDKVHDIYRKQCTTNSFHNLTGIYSLAKGTTMDKDLNIKIKKLTR